MDIIHINNDDICFKCKNTLQSLKTALVGCDKADGHVRDWVAFFRHRDHIDAKIKSLFEHTSKNIMECKTKCPICYFVLAQLSPTWLKIWRGQDRSTSLSKENIDQMKVELGGKRIVVRRALENNAGPIGFFIARPPVYYDFFHLYIDQNPSTLCGLISEYMSPLSSSDCPEAFRFIKSRAEECHSHHSMCHDERVRYSSPPKLPSRVLDLAPASAIGSKALKLVETHSNMCGFYTALSHCWGPEHKRPLSTKSTLEARKLEIDWNDLPQIFQDAVITSRGLGIQYLWIDSLCIIQDDTDDWRHQSARMADVYSNAWVTIAASYAHNSTEGLFDACYRPRLELLCLQNQDSSEIAKETDYLGVAHGHLCRKYLELSQPDLEVLATRGWTLQEALLSRCVIYFTRHFLFWSCRTISIDERGVEYSPKASPRQHNDSWYRVVENFSRRELTYATDKLVALDGIQSYFRTAHSSIYGEEYLYGHWTKHLPNSLLWMTGDAKRHLNPLQMPTWSWASSMSWVEWAHLPQTLEGRCTVVTLPTSTDPRIVLLGKIKTFARSSYNLWHPNRPAGGLIQYDGDAGYGVIYGLLVAAWNPPTMPDEYKFLKTTNKTQAQALLIKRGPKFKSTYMRVGTISFTTEEWFNDCVLRKITLV